LFELGDLVADYARKAHLSATIQNTLRLSKDLTRISQFNYTEHKVQNIRFVKQPTMRLLSAMVGTGN